MFRDSYSQTALKRIRSHKLQIGKQDFTYRDTANWSLKLSKPLIHIEADVEEINKEYPCQQFGIGANPKISTQNS